MNKKPRSNSSAGIITIVFAVVILIPSMLGFGTKFIEFVHTFRGESDGVFAITPMVNYLLASLGFFVLLIWATINGMFHDIERPKHTMLLQEEQLDRQMSSAHARPPG
jgi:nitrogen fixation-related uncharacterized protein